ncbi:MAG: excinuclease ABC subunit UvrA, partial [Firmicutes bacterium]|nr:excinuclease ABC subunit UvrA [Bacillota bacterium]
SFNAPFGSCPSCNGLGFIQKIDPDLLYTKTGKRMPIEMVHYYQKRYEATYSDYFKNEISKFTVTKTCPDCNGKRLKKEVLAVTVGGKNIAEISDMSVSECLNFFGSLKLTPTEEKIGHQILKEITSRLQFLKDVGLDYLTLSRSSATLSGGESQRIRLATQIGSSLMGVLYILDEPSIGLHQKDNEKLLATLRHLTDIGNTLIVVEHDEDTMYAADYIVDVGPGAGLHGGEIVAAGSIDDIKKCKESITGQYLRGDKRIEVPTHRRPGNGEFIKVVGAREHNLQGIDVEFPLGRFICVTGVSGSGKSSLVNEILYKSAAREIYGSKDEPGEHEKLVGLEHIDKVIDIDQSPIGRTPRSNPATYTGVFTNIRDLFAELPESKLRGYAKGRYSFNVKGGRCESCMGDGIIKIEMHFLSDVYVPCEVCHGQRYNRETLEVKYKGKSINDVLEMTVSEALEFFKNIPSIVRQLSTLEQVGLGYIKLGQPSTQLSGGEAQRVKLATELSKRSTGRTLYILDEPTTGLHFADVDKLIQVLDRLVDAGNTVVVIEHNLDVIKRADYIIDMGPDGGDRGGRVVVTGTPEEVAKHKTSYTAEFLRKILKNK